MLQFQVREQKSHTEQGMNFMEVAAHIQCFVGLNIGQKHWQQMDAALGVFIGCVTPSLQNYHVILPMGGGYRLYAGEPFHTSGRTKTP